MAGRHIDIRMPPGASPEEAAAIAAAINSHVQVDDGEARRDDHRWQGRRWRFTARIESIHGTTVRLPRRAPTPAWRAAGRTDRL